MIIRISSFFAIVLIGIFLPLWVFVCGACIYAFFYIPYELLIVSVFIDAQFGDAHTGVWFVYTLVVIALLSLSILSKPYLRFYR